MKDRPATKQTLNDAFNEIAEELEKTPNLLISTNDANVGKDGLRNLWMKWLVPMTKYLVSCGAKMPLAIKADGTPYGERDFTTSDAHHYFTSTILGLDKDGVRLSWSRSGQDGRRAATKWERFYALQRMQEFAMERGIPLMTNRGDEYSRMEKEQNRQEG
jgi:hypothetical protein